MIRILWTAATGMKAQELNVDVIANNLANVSTTGFKSGRAEFQDLMYQTLRETGSAVTADNLLPIGIQIGHGTRPVAVVPNLSQGNLQQTNNQLDLAIEGQGFFQVQRPDGTTAYTRAGDFKLDGNGRVVTSDGYPLQPELTIPTDASSISVGVDGTVSVLEAGQTAPTQIGTLTLARFTNPAGLNRIGRNLLTETQTSGTPITGTAGDSGFGTISQGYLESSNVNVVEEMVKMITAQRAYEINSKTIQTADQMLQLANQTKR
jgi:flagellar basal-body rod protein FlgG